MANEFNGIKSNLTVTVDVETTGLTIGPLPTQYPQVPGTWKPLCPEEVNYSFSREYDERNPLCLYGGVDIETKKTMSISISGYLKENPTTAEGEKYLKDNQYTLSHGLFKIRDTTWNETKEYVGYMPFDTHEYPAVGGEIREYSIEGEAKQHMQGPVV